ncbi:hypothetical protein [Absidia glauca]|uniref:L-ascorbate oxidase n=1 Tax=Absidia glauca TaxID=4829 RepID=A0A168QL96_ABSGL|nr:hypothetical protein [Absidia glauca]
MLIHCLSCWLLLIFLETIQCAQTHHYELTLTMKPLNPDCSNYTSVDALFINDQMPGPTITASKGDRILVHFRNHLPPATHSNANVSSSHSDDNGVDPNSATLHFHGVHQTGTPQADGVPFLTQDPVKPGDGRYLYDFSVGHQSGTFFYHAHVGLQDFYGAFIVYESDTADPSLRKPSEQQLSLGKGNATFDDERTLILSEWHHHTRSDLESFIIGPNYTHIPNADSLLINGKAIFDDKHVSDLCSGYHQMEVESNRTYRLRIIGATTHRTLGFAVAHHRLTIIEVDGYLVTPYETDYLEVAPGQRFSVLLTTDQTPMDYAIGTTRRYVTNKDLQQSLVSSNGWAILHYQNGTNSTQRPYYTLPHNHPTFPANDTPQWIWNELKPLYVSAKHDELLRRKPSRTILLNTTNRRIPGNGGLVQRFYTNNITFEAPRSTLLQQILKGTRTKSRYTISQLMMDNATAQGYDPDLGTYPLQYMETVDFVIQNTHTPGFPCHQHPWHSHGHSHWVIAFGPGSYNDAKHGHIRNVPAPVLKDTTTVYPMIQPGADQDAMKNSTLLEPRGCGWSKIRIIALHCHIAPHMLQGMMVVLEEGADLIRSHSHLMNLVHRST